MKRKGASRRVKRKEQDSSELIRFVDQATERCHNLKTLGQLLACGRLEQADPIQLQHAGYMILEDSRQLHVMLRELNRSPSACVRLRRDRKSKAQGPKSKRRK